MTRALSIGGAQAETLLNRCGSCGDGSNTRWSSRVESLDGLLMLTCGWAAAAGTAGPLGHHQGRQGGDTPLPEGGRAVVESRALMRRLEGLLAERLGDSHPKVALAALRLLTALMQHHRDTLAGHLSALLPRVFPRLGDPKEPVREAASKALDTSRSYYEAPQLCAILCPRVLELPPGAARDGLLEFLVALVPHASSFLGNPGHLRSLVQRLATALAQVATPPSHGHGAGPGQGIAGAGTGAGVGVEDPRTAAAARVMTSLFYLNREAFLSAAIPLPLDLLPSVRLALAGAIPDISNIMTEHRRRSTVAQGSGLGVRTGAAEAEGGHELKSPQEVGVGGVENG
ncbi:unnamed protein product, partial [Discosporangium mesarthrocarpum]